MHLSEFTGVICCIEGTEESTIGYYNSKQNAKCTSLDP